MAKILPGYERYPQADGRKPGEVEGGPLKKPRKSRWMRERKRSNLKRISRVPASVFQTEQNTYYLRDDVLDIRKQVKYLEYVIFELRERG